MSFKIVIYYFPVSFTADNRVHMVKFKCKFTLQLHCVNCIVTMTKHEWLTSGCLSGCFPDREGEKRFHCIISYLFQIPKQELNIYNAGIVFFFCYPGHYMLHLRALYSMTSLAFSSVAVARHSHVQLKL